MKHHCIQLTLSCSLAAVLAGALAQPARAGNGIDTWSGGSGTSSNWSDPANWNPANSTNVPPLAGDLLVFSGSSRPAPNNDYAPGTAFDGISLNTSVPFVLGGNSVLLSGNFLAVSNGIVNNSGFFQTVNLNVNLDWGYHLFASPAGTLALDGSITPGTGSVAYFGPNNVNSTALAVDRSGLISGLNSDAFIVNSAGGVAGLATLDATGTNIVQYLFSASAQFGSGTLPTDGVNGTNIETTANTTTTYTFPGSPDGNLYVNAIQVDAAAAATTLAWGSASTHTNLVLGTVNGIGAIYTPNTTTAGRLVIGSGNGSFLTAGPMTGNPVPGQIIFAINGSNTSNEAENNANTIDNASGGAVTVVKAGTGSMYFNQTNNYSGGTYIAQGYLQGNTAQAFGTGPVYVAAGATVFPQHNGGIYPNNFYLSPGFGFSGNSPATVGAMKFAAANAGASGTITLEGPSVTNAPGDRISESTSGGVITLSGRITGTGTLDFYANAATTTMFLSNVTANANNWTGGLIVNGANNDSAYLRLGAANQLANNDVTLAQAGTGIARLDLNGYSDTIGALNSSANGNNQVADSASAASTLTIGADNSNASFGGSLQGAGLSIVKTGSGTQIFSGTNTSGGGTYVTGGALVLTGPANLNSNALVAVSGATLDLSGLDNPAGANATLSLTNSLLVIGTPNTPITNEVAATLNLGGTSNVISFASLPLITGYPATVHVISYGTLNGAFNFILGSLPVDSPAFKGYLTNENNFIDLVVTNGPTPVRHLTWTGNAGNAWDVATTANWKGTNGLATIYNQSDFVLFDDSASGASTVNLATALTPGTMTVSNSTVAYTFNSSGKISGDISLLKMGTNSVLFDESGGNDFTGGVLISNGIVQVGNGDGLGSIGSGPVVNNGALILNRGSTSVISNAISGLGSLTQEGGDTVVLAGNNSFTGAALVESNSVLMLGASAALGSSTAVADGSRLDLNGFMAGGSVIAQGNGGGNGAVDNSSTNIPAGYTGVTNLTLTGDTTIGASGNRWDLRSPGGTGGDPSGAVLSTGGQPYNLAKTGTGGGTGFIGLVSVTVDTNLANIDVQQGTLEVEGNTTGLGNPTNTLTVESGATLELFSATNHFNKVIQLDDGGTIMNGSGANIIVGPMVVTNPGFSSYCTFVINGTSLTLTNVITGDGTIYRTLTGSNALYLNGNSPDFAGGLYLGGGVTVLNGTLNNGLGAQVSNGKFYVNGELQGSGITGGFQGTVLGTGIVDGASTISGTLDPGDVGTPGTFTVGGLTIGALATLNFDLGNDTTPGNATNDLVVVNGDLTVNGGTININPLGLLQTGVSYRLFNYTGALNLNASFTVNNANGYTFTIDTSTPGQVNLVASGGPPVWNGGSATDSNWSDAANWAGVSIVANDPLYFGGNLRLNNTNDTTAGTSYGDIEFLSGAGSFVLNGNSIVSSGNIINNSTNPQAVNLPVSFGATETFNGGSGGLTIGGGITSTANSTLTLMGNGVLTNLIAGQTNIISVGSTNANWTLVDNATSVPMIQPVQLDMLEGNFTFGQNGSAPVLYSTASKNNSRLGVITGVPATFNMVSGTLTLTARFNTGAGANTIAILNQSGGTFSNALFQCSDSSAAALTTVNITGGSFNVADSGGLHQIYLASRGTGVVTVASSGVINCSTLDVSRNAAGNTQGSQGTVNLESGGTIVCSKVTTASSAAQAGPPSTGIQPTATFNFDGGTLEANAGSSTFFQGRTSSPSLPITTIVKAGGAIIDDGGNNIGFLEPLQHDSTLGSTPDGGLVKLGVGTLTIGSACTYIGDTTVGAGTLAVNGSLGQTAVTVETNATLAGGGSLGSNVTVNAGGTLAPAGIGTIGTLTVGGNVTFLGGSTNAMELDYTASTGDEIVATAAVPTTITYGGTLMLTNLTAVLTTNDTFKLFSASNYAGAFAAIVPASPAPGFGWNTSTLAADGTLRIIATVNLNPTNVTATVSGNQLILTWPADHTGWHLQVQTNSLATGLGTNWVTIPGTDQADSYTNIVDPSQGTIFYRMTYP